MVFVGVDWAEAHHDVCLINQEGGLLAARRISEDPSGLEQLHALLAEHAGQPDEVVIGIETNRGLLVAALVAAGYQVYAINPKAVSRYRERHVSSGAKSDPRDAKVLADLVRTDRHNHRPLAADSDQALSIGVLARAHQSLVWTRQRQLNQLRSTLREFYPGALAAFGGELAERDALAILEQAPTPERGRRLSLAKLASTLRRAGRQRNVEAKAAQIQAHLRAPQLEASPAVAQAFGHSVTASVSLLKQINLEIAKLEAELKAGFELHPDAEIYLSLPGLGVVLGARALAEFGDDPTRFKDARARKNYAGSAPLTIASGTRKTVIARWARNDRLAHLCYLWAFSALTASPGARRYYDSQRARHKTHHQALRALGNRLVGILHGCLTHRQSYREALAWLHVELAA